jgi:hypothetical protein
MRNLIFGAIVLTVGATWAKPPLDEDMSGKRELHMANCPSAVSGASTKVVDLEDGVELTVTAREQWAQQKIRRRAQTQGEAAWQPERRSIEHTGLGTGSGRFGFCPGMLEATTVDAELLPDGARITVHADRPSQVARLKRTTHHRLDALRKQRAPRS